MSGMLPTHLVNSAHETIRQYDLINRSRPLVVALSGGKDSLLLCLVLRDLGIEHRAVTIDMGYETGWDRRVAQLARQVGIATEIVCARETADNQDQGIITPGVRPRLTVLNAFSSATTSAATPCTYCYSVKALLLETAAERIGASQVAFAHHITDAAASLLKEALLHVDRLDRGHIRYQRSNFDALVRELADIAEHYESAVGSALLHAIDSLVTSARVGTDEPPRQPLRQDRPGGIEIVRPFFGIDEDSIVRAVAGLGLRTEGPGCGHGATAASETPREMVHHRVLAGRGNTDFFRHVTDLVTRGIDKNGFAITRSRARRQELLGQQYKPVIDQFDKL